jgi:hypothetical protein
MGVVGIERKKISRRTQSEHLFEMARHLVDELTRELDLGLPVSSDEIRFAKHAGLRWQRIANSRAVTFLVVICRANFFRAEIPWVTQRIRLHIGRMYNHDG